MNQATLKMALALAALWAGTFSPATAATSEINFAVDVEQQFRDLMPRPDAMGFGIGPSNGASTCKHFQGIVRHHGPDGTPYLILSKNGNPSCPADVDGDDGHGYIYIVRMDSRDRNGERLRSNRIARVTGSGDPASDNNFITDDTPPEQEDEVIKVIYLDGTGGWPHFRHPGGMQIIGNTLVVPIDSPPLARRCPANRTCPSLPSLPPRILFIDISDPESPQHLHEFELPGDSDQQAAAVAITVLPNGDYLMAVLRPQSYRLEIFQSNGTDLTSWQFRDDWYPNELLGGAAWPADKVNSHQILNFVREGDLNGSLYLIGGRKDALVFDVDDYFDLYRVDLIDWNSDSAPPRFQLTRIRRKGIVPRPLTGGLVRTLDLKAASGAYVSPSGELILYACEHANDGPEVNGDDSVKCGELRHVDIQRLDNPGYAPTVFLDGEFEVDEGGATEVSAYGEAPLSRAWIQLFTASGLNYESNIGVVAEYDDWYKEDYDDFAKLGIPKGVVCTTTSDETMNCTIPPPCASGFSNVVYALVCAQGMHDYRQRRIFR